MKVKIIYELTVEGAAADIICASAALVRDGVILNAIAEHDIPGVGPVKTLGLATRIELLSQPFYSKAPGLMERFNTPAGLSAVATSSASSIVAPARVFVSRPTFALERSRLGRRGMLEGYSTATGFAAVRFDNEELRVEELLIHPECLDLETNDAS